MLDYLAPLENIKVLESLLENGEAITDHEKFVILNKKTENIVTVAIIHRVSNLVGIADIDIHDVIIVNSRIMARIIYDYNTLRENAKLILDDTRLLGYNYLHPQGTIRMDYDKLRLMLLWAKEFDGEFIPYMYNEELVYIRYDKKNDTISLMNNQGEFSVVASGEMGEPSVSEMFETIMSDKENRKTLLDYGNCKISENLYAVFLYEIDNHRILVALVENDKYITHILETNRSLTKVKVILDDIIELPDENLIYDHSEYSLYYDLFLSLVDFKYHGTFKVSEQEYDALYEYAKQFKGLFAFYRSGDKYEYVKYDTFSHKIFILDKRYLREIVYED